MLDSTGVVVASGRVLRSCTGAVPKIRFDFQVAALSTPEDVALMRCHNMRIAVVPESPKARLGSTDAGAES